MITYEGQTDLDPLIDILKTNNPNLPYTGDPELDLLVLEEHELLTINAAGAAAVERSGGKLIHA
jgi:hypothetical protein